MGYVYKKKQNIYEGRVFFLLFFFCSGKPMSKCITAVIDCIDNALAWNLCTVANSTFCYTSIHIYKNAGIYIYIVCICNNS